MPSGCEETSIENADTLKGSHECGKQNCVVKGSMSEDIKTQNECLHDKKGVCSRHGIVGRKLTRTKRHWTEKKDVTYGNNWKKETYSICICTA